MSLTAQHILRRAHETFDIEASAITGLKARTGESFVKAVNTMLDIPGRVVVSGMGKSGHVGRKIAATLASTGTPAMFVHPAEASHGDLGMITGGDLVLAISNSGETAELVNILPVIKRLGISLVAMTAGAGSTLAQQADIVLDTRVEREACPLMLAPTSSTTAQMAMGDALAMALLEARGFREEDFARSHPGGALGRRLLTHVSDVMRSGAQLPCAAASATLMELMAEMSAGAMGVCVIVDGQQRILGIFTDGDLRRLIEKGGELRNLRANEIMHTQPHTIAPAALAADAARMMEQHHITSVLVADEAQRLLGIVHIGDLMRAKVI